MVILKYITGTYSKLPHDTSKENWIYSGILNSGCTVDKMSIGGIFEYRNGWISGTPIDLKFIGPENVKENEISILALKQRVDRKNEYVTLIKGEDYDVVNGLYTMRLSSTELRKKYGLVADSIELYLKYKDNKMQFCNSFVDSVDSNVIGDFSGDGALDASDFIIYSKYYAGEYDLTKYSYTKKKLDEFKAYVQQQGYDSSDEDVCIYVLRKLVLKERLKKG